MTTKNNAARLVNGTASGYDYRCPHSKPAELLWHATLPHQAKGAHHG